MSSRQLKTLLVGFGNIGAGLADDPVMGRYFEYATHAQVLRDHPLFCWDAVIDAAPEALERARACWNIPIIARSTAELPDSFDPDVAVIATPPDERLAIFEQLPGVKGVLLEKPLGTSYDASAAFVESCARRNIKLQVNFWRRGDELYQKLAQGELLNRIGKVQVAYGIYGNGIMNNGSHMIDFVQMLMGEVDDFGVLQSESAFCEGPVAGDVNVPFRLRTNRGSNVYFSPVVFKHYRENSLDIWGERGRLAICQGGLGVYEFPRRANRALQGSYEIASDDPHIMPATCGKALYRLYDNFANSLLDNSALWSSGLAALRTEKIIHSLLAELNGAPYSPQTA